jgi:hypothetical protein
VVSFMLRPLYPQGLESPWYPLDRKLGVPQSRSGRVGEEKNSQPRRESNPRTPVFQPVTQSYTDWAITAPPCVCMCARAREREIKSVTLDISHYEESEYFFCFVEYSTYRKKICSKQNLHILMPSVFYVT